MIRGIVVFAIACSVCVALPADVFHVTTDEIGSVEGCNKFVDDMFDRTRRFEVDDEESIDPMVYGNYTKEIPYDLWVTSGSIYASVYNTIIRGLSTIKRAGNCKTANVQGKSGMIVPMQFDQINLESNVILTVAGYGPDAKVTGVVGPSTGEMFVYVRDDKETGEAKATVIYILIKRMDKVDITLEGLPGPVQWVASFVKTGFILIYKEIIKLAIGGILVPFVNGLIE